MRYLSLFSGIEAASVAWKPLGWECVGVAEIEPFPCAVLSYHFPDTPNLGDITKISEEQIKSLGKIDLIVGGFPCQDLSVAGKRKGLHNADGTRTRSGLFFDAMRIVEWAREHCGLRFLLIENVPGLFSSNGGRDFASVLGQMVGTVFELPRGFGWSSGGIAIGPNGSAEWVILDAQYFGVAQRRRRVFALADFGDWFNRPPILLERESLLGNPPPRRGQQQGSTESSSSGVEIRSHWDGDYPHPTLNQSSKGSGGVGSSNQEIFCQQGAYLVPAVIMAHEQANAEIRDDGGAPALTCNHEAPILAFPANLSGTQYASAENLAPSMGAKNPTAIAIQDVRGMDKAQNGKGWSDEGTAYTVDSMATQGVATLQDASKCVVRRILPVEAEALQGFPRNWTRIPWRGKAVEDCPDAPRYKALGNSFAVPVVRWIGERIEKMVGMMPGKVE